MISISIPVPDGFVVLTDAFTKFTKEYELDSLIKSTLNSIRKNDNQAIQLASKTIRNAILSKRIPRDIETEIQKQFKKLNSKFVAVRSSATAEDSSKAAWAGQLESFLNTDSHHLLENIKKCWSSLYTARAILYRADQGLINKKVLVAVVVQKMINSEKSGIAFSVHPITQNNNQIIIEAGFGLGEAVVGGEITPDTYIFDKSLKEITETTISRQNKGLFRSNKAGNIWVKIDQPYASAQKLSTNEIHRLSDLIIKIEKHYGFPCDIEWAIEKEKISIVQSRPITTLSAKKDNQRKLDWENLFEVPFRSAIYLELGLKIYSRKSRFKSLPGCHNNYAAFYQYKKGVTSYLTKEEIGKSAELGADAHLQTDFMRSYIAEGNKLTKKISDFYENSKFKKPYSKSEITNKFATLCDLLEESLARYKLCNDEFQVKIYNEIKLWLKKNNKPLDSIQELATPHITNTLDFMELEILQAAKAYQRKDKTKLDNTASILAAKYAAIGAGAEGGKIWDKKFFLQEILKRRNHWTTEKINRSIANIEQKEKNWLLKKEKLDQKLKLPKRYGQILEQMAQLAHLKFEIRIGWAYLDQITEKLYRIIGAQHRIPSAHLAYYNSREIKELINRGCTLPSLNERKLSSFYIVEKGIYSSYYGKISLKKFNNEFKKQEIADSNLIRGQIASGGFATGKAKIVSPLKNQEKELNKIKKGDILITGMTRPHMLQAMKKAVAFVTDEGGVTCHAAIISREMKKPCIVATRLATKIIKDGDIVEVDAMKGIVKIIKRKTS